MTVKKNPDHLPTYGVGPIYVYRILIPGIIFALIAAALVGLLVLWIR